MGGDPHFDMCIFSTLAVNQSFRSTKERETWESSYLTHYARLDARELEALATYKNDDYYESINTLLRKNKVISISRDRAVLRDIRKKLKEVIRNVDSALAKIRLDRPLTVYRGVNLNRSFQLTRVQKPYIDSAFMSVTLNPFQTKSFCDMNGVIMEITVPAGTQAIPISPALFSSYAVQVPNGVQRLLKEEEILLPRNLLVTCESIRELEKVPGYPSYLAYAKLSLTDFPTL